MQLEQEKHRLVVIKFGGSSLATPKRVRRAAQRVRLHYSAGRRLVVVVSAIGHTTDRILRVMEACAPAAGAAAAAAAREADRALATGEDLAAALLAAALIPLNVPAISLRGGEAGLLAIGSFGQGELHDLRRERLEALLAARFVPVVAGFQAVRPDGQTVTLGRGGSDTSAVFIAGALGAAECHIVTDVDGVFDQDPRTNPNAHLHDRLSYLELIRLVDAGAHIIHPKAARLARDFCLPLHVYSFRSSLRWSVGTIVGARSIPSFEEAV